MSHGTDEGNDSEPSDRRTEGETRPTTVRHEWHRSGDPSVALVQAVAAATNRETTDLPLLQQHVDPDAIDALLTADRSSVVSISFRYADTAVTMRGDGTIEIEVDGHRTQGDRK